MIDKEKQDLINFIEEGQKRIDSAKRKLVETTDSFDIWLKYGIDKQEYPFLLGRDNPIRIYFDEYFDWMYSECRYMTIDIHWILESLEEMLIEGKIDQDYVDEMKETLRRSNFGSMCIDW